MLSRTCLAIVSVSMVGLSSKRPRSCPICSLKDPRSGPSRCSTARKRSRTSGGSPRSSKAAICVCMSLKSTCGMSILSLTRLAMASGSTVGRSSKRPRSRPICSRSPLKSGASLCSTDLSRSKMSGSTRPRPSSNWRRSSSICRCAFGLKSGDWKRSSSRSCTCRRISSTSICGPKSTCALSCPIDSLI